MNTSTKVIVGLLILVAAIISIFLLQNQGISVLPLMSFPLFVVGGLVFVICSFILAAAAFNEDIGKGLLFVFVPFYNFVFAFTQYKGKHKTTVLAVWSGGAVSVFIGILLLFLELPAII